MRMYCNICSSKCLRSKFDQLNSSLETMLHMKNVGGKKQLSCAALCITLSEGLGPSEAGL